MMQNNQQQHLAQLYNQGVRLLDSGNHQNVISSGKTLKQNNPNNEVEEAAEPKVSTNININNS